MAERPDLAEVESFNKSELKPTDTTEKSGALEGYAQEKTLEQVASFSKEQLKHVETDEKNALPTQSEIEQEKKSNF